MLLVLLAGCFPQSKLGSLPAAHMGLPIVPKPVQNAHVGGFTPSHDMYSFRLGQVGLGHRPDMAWLEHAVHTPLSL